MLTEEAKAEIENEPLIQNEINKTNNAKSSKESIDFRYPPNFDHISSSYDTISTLFYMGMYHIYPNLIVEVMTDQ